MTKWVAICTTLVALAWVGVAAADTLQGKLTGSTTDFTITTPITDASTSFVGNENPIRIAHTFAYASTTWTAKGFLLRWRTTTEVDLLGFHVCRSRGDSWQRLTRSLIAAKGSVSGASYRFLDKTARRGVSYRYRITPVRP